MATVRKASKDEAQWLLSLVYIWLPNRGNAAAGLKLAIFHARAAESRQPPGLTPHAPQNRLCQGKLVASRR